MADKIPTKQRIEEAKRKLELAAESEEHPDLKAKLLTGAEFLDGLAQYAEVVQSGATSTPEEEAAAGGDEAQVDS